MGHDLVVHVALQIFLREAVGSAQEAVVFDKASGQETVVAEILNIVERNANGRDERG